MKKENSKQQVDFDFDVKKHGGRKKELGRLRQPGADDEYRQNREHGCGPGEVNHKISYLQVVHFV